MSQNEGIGPTESYFQGSLAWLVSGRVWDSVRAALYTQKKTFLENEDASLPLKKKILFCDILKNYALLPRISSKSHWKLFAPKKTCFTFQRLIFGAAMFVSGMYLQYTIENSKKIAGFQMRFLPFYTRPFAQVPCLFSGAKSKSYTNPADLFLGGGWPHSLLGLFQEIKLPTGPTFHGPRKNLSIS